MDYKVYKLQFQGAVHFGGNSLEDGEHTFCADTLFSALCQEALKMGENVFQCFYQYVKDEILLLSDAFPYSGASYYLPKPVKHIETGEQTGDSILKKAYKKLKYIPVELFSSYLSGEYDILNAPVLDKLGHFEMKVLASIRGEEETKPYRVGTYYYHEGNGVYVIIGYQQQKALELLEELFESLSFSGIGGKRAAGLGRFVLFPGKINADIYNRLKGNGKQYMSLSVSLPTEEEMEAAMSEAEYLLCKRSGFVASEQYSDKQMRKRDLYVLKAGSCFGFRYHGDLYDVSDKGGRHPVYRYGKPMFMEVDA